MALTEKLTAIADAVRSKTGKTDLLKLEDMPNEIATIQSLADLPEEMFAFSGNCSYLFANAGWANLINYFGQFIKIENVTNCSSMFSFCSQITNIPFEINLTGTSHDFSYLFRGCENLESVPKINNGVPIYLESMFQGCKRLEKIPENIVDWFDWSAVEASTDNNKGRMQNLCADCHSLRSLPMDMYRKAGKNVNYNYTIYYGLSQACSSLDEIVDIPFPHEKDMTSNMFFNAAVAGRIKRFTFEMPNGKPKVVNWKNQNISFTSTGHNTSPTTIENCNNSITKDEYVFDDLTYNALKNTQNWFTNLQNYSRYNHDSAVETINSLPDTSAYLATAGGTNTITFMKNAGSKTDGGAIGNLTAEEIAVATAKGWTVTLR